MLDALGRGGYWTYVHYVGDHDGGHDVSRRHAYDPDVYNR